MIEAIAGFYWLGQKGLRRDIMKVRFIYSACIEIQTNEIIKTKKRLNEIYSKHTGKKYNKVLEIMERDCFFSPYEAVEFGLIDNVIENRSANKTNE